MLGRGHVTKRDQNRPRHGVRILLDEGTEARGVKSRRLLGLAGYAVLTRMGRAVFLTAGVIHRGVLDGMVMVGGHCGRGRLRRDGR
ncbi:hypothetical protein GCM10010346_62370 [Streptomyces chryseus]|uniref:Uncharacterized protein n=1 Tax=Streptomyces chryseus TaxID=68186 RepID=A0ABQ3ECE6_9ACTN|nr:hypothetical protein GCM10010346_62370 [Streptomyces chryseus]